MGKTLSRLVQSRFTHAAILRNTDGVILRIDEEEASRIPNKTEHMAAPGFESQYIIGLDVFHQLHVSSCKHIYMVLNSYTFIVPGYDSLVLFPR